MYSYVTITSGSCDHNKVFQEKLGDGWSVRSHQFYQWINMTLIMQVFTITILWFRDDQAKFGALIQTIYVIFSPISPYPAYLDFRRSFSTCLAGSGAKWRGAEWQTLLERR